MRQQIAGFLGELAEELGWAPDLDHARVKPETSRPERPKKSAVIMPDPQDLRSLATPVDRLRAELDQLHSTVKHLGSEIIQLRAQMRRLPAPPDADVVDDVTPEIDVAAGPPHVDPDGTERPPIEGVSDTATAEPEARPWPPQLVPVPTAEPAPTVTPSQPDAATEPAATEAPAARESVDTDRVTATVANDGPHGTEQEPTPEPVAEPAAVLSEPTPNVVEVDAPDSALELFPSEPASPADDTAGAEERNEVAQEQEDEAGATAYGKSLYRRMGGSAH